MARMERWELWGRGAALLEGQDTGELGEAGRVDAHVRPIGKDEKHFERGCRFCRQGRGGLTGPPRKLGGGHRGGGAGQHGPE